MAAYNRSIPLPQHILNLIPLQQSEKMTCCSAFHFSADCKCTLPCQWIFRSSSDGGAGGKLSGLVRDFSTNSSTDNAEIYDYECRIVCCELLSHPTAHSSQRRCLTLTLGAMMAGRTGQALIYPSPPPEEVRTSAPGWTQSLSWCLLWWEDPPRLLIPVFVLIIKLHPGFSLPFLSHSHTQLILLRAINTTRGRR